MEGCLSICRLEPDMPGCPGLKMCGTGRKSGVPGGGGAFVPAPTNNSAELFTWTGGVCPRRSLEILGSRQPQGLVCCY